MGAFLEKWIIWWISGRFFFSWSHCIPSCFSTWWIFRLPHDVQCHLTSLVRLLAPLLLDVRHHRAGQMWTLIAEKKLIMTISGRGLLIPAHLSIPHVESEAYRFRGDVRVWSPAFQQEAASWSAPICQAAPRCAGTPLARLWTSLRQTVPSRPPRPPVAPAAAGFGEQTKAFHRTITHARTSLVCFS